MNIPRIIILLSTFLIIFSFGDKKHEILKEIQGKWQVFDNDNPEVYVLIKGKTWVTHFGDSGELIYTIKEVKDSIIVRVLKENITNGILINEAGREENIKIKQFGPNVLHFVPYGKLDGKFREGACQVLCRDNTKPLKIKNRCYNGNLTLKSYTQDD
jgi:hypothetical protein